MAEGYHGVHEKLVDHFGPTEDALYTFVGYSGGQGETQPRFCQEGTPLKDTLEGTERDRERHPVAVKLWLESWCLRGCAKRVRVSVSNRCMAARLLGKVLRLWKLDLVADLHQEPKVRHSGSWSGRRIFAQCLHYVTCILYVPSVHTLDHSRSEAFVSIKFS